jgi:hypothetical protein
VLAKIMLVAAFCPFLRVAILRDAALRYAPQDEVGVQPKRLNSRPVEKFTNSERSEGPRACPKNTC